MQVKVFNHQIKWSARITIRGFIRNNKKDKAARFSKIKTEERVEELLNFIYATVSNT